MNVMFDRKLFFFFLSSITLHDTPITPGWRPGPGPVFWMRCQAEVLTPPVVTISDGGGGYLPGTVTP